MPTNILRKSSDGKKAAAKVQRVPGQVRRAVLTASRISIRIELGTSATADLVWSALPLHSTAETWGQAIHFETPLEAGRDRSARVLATAGEIYFWVENDRIMVPFGRTPISKPGEVRLPSPCNPWAKALDDVTLLEAIKPGEKVSLVPA